ncbi:hypothetical protein [Methylomonas sp. MK1]|uniref:hypothetical protein n=1 Tax=Methylomonas sp. MK1 TaxID=1131552 RepID=UPI001360B295|nr:hypothetical protein [Methylomonas sp. MK1]
MTAILHEDLLALGNSESGSQHWRRNYIRVSASLIEGYAHCLREMCSISFECIAPDISQKEEKVIRSERSFDANDRIRLTLRAAYKLFELQSTSNFGGPEWPRAQRILEKRHLLMHPKSPSDLNIPDDIWEELREDVTWLIERFFNSMSALEEKHGG